jgi:hypothetical membrane protein
VFGGLEYFGIIPPRGTMTAMTAWDWIRIIGGLVLLWETYRQRQKKPKMKTWILLLVASLGLILTGAFHI